MSLTAEIFGADLGDDSAIEDHDTETQNCLNFDRVTNRFDFLENSFSGSESNETRRAYAVFLDTNQVKFRKDRIGANTVFDEKGWYIAAEWNYIGTSCTI